MILVTGGTGLVGSHLLYALLQKGGQVRALKRPQSGNADIANLFECFAPGSASLASRIEWVEGDVLDPDSLHKAMDGVQQVYHCAALVSFNARDRQKMLLVNVQGTANVVNACLEQGIKKLCHVSSIAALGRSERGEMIDENTRWKTSRLNSGYAVSKYGGEREVWRGIEEGLNAVIVNPSVILGLSCRADAGGNLIHNIPKFLKFYSNGINGYVDVRDVVAGMIILMESGVSAQRFVLNSQNLSIRELFNCASSILGKHKPVIPLNKPLLMGFASVGEFIGRLAGSSPLLTREIIRPIFSKWNYSAENFRQAFSYEFRPIEQTLRDNFKLLGKI